MVKDSGDVTIILIVSAIIVTPLIIATIITDTISNTASTISVAVQTIATAPFC